MENSRHSPVSPPFRGCLANLLVLSVGAGLCSGERASHPPRGPERGPDVPRLCFSGAPCLGAAAHSTHTRRGCELRRLRRDRPSTISAHEEERLPALGPGLACTP